MLPFQPGTILTAEDLNEGFASKADAEHTHGKASVGLGNVDNTADVDKPVSTAQAAAIEALNAAMEQKQVDLAAVGGAELVGYSTELNFIGQSVQSALTEIGRRISGGLNVLTKMTLAEQVDAMSGSPAMDHTASIVSANAASKVLIFPAGYTFNLQNWEPLAGTIIAADGATIQRFGSATFGATGSSGAVIVTNDGIEVQGGRWKDRSGITQNTWSGAFVINGGDNFTIHHHYEITGTWGAITGHQAQNGALVSKNMRILNGWLHHNAHNTYLADIDGLTFVGNISEYADRDGFKTYRNVLNVIACLNHCRYNGNGAVGQSQDGMDFFIGGERCIVALNFLHNNVGKGIDIKRNSSGAAETVQNRNYIIGMNFGFGNGDIGLQTEEADSAGKMSDLTIIANHFFGNGGRGAYLGSLQNSKFVGNHIYNNGSDGLRVDTADGLLLTQNVAYGNASTGYNIVSGTGITATGNIGRGGATQTNGMLWAEAAAGKCFDNDLSGHTTDYLASGTNPLVRGKTLDAKFTNTTASQLIAMTRKGACAQLELLLNNTATMDVILSKRNAATGANDGNVISVTAKSFPTVYVAGLTGVTGSNALRQFAGSNGMLLTLANITSGFTDGMARIHYID